MSLPQRHRHWFWYWSFSWNRYISFSNTEARKYGGKNTGRRRKRWNVLKWVNFKDWKNTSHIPNLGFSYIFSYKHTHTLSLLHVYCILSMYIYTNTERAETFNTGYHFITLIFKGIVWLCIKLLSDINIRFSGFSWMCSQLHGNPSPYFSKQFSRTVCLHWDLPTTLMLVCNHNSLNFR